MEYLCFKVLCSLMLGHGLRRGLQTISVGKKIVLKLDYMERKQVIHMET